MVEQVPIHTCLLVVLIVLIDLYFLAFVLLLLSYRYGMFLSPGGAGGHT